MDSFSTSLRNFLTSARWYQLLVVIGALVLSCYGVTQLVKEDQPLVFLFLILGLLALPAVLINPRWGLFVFLWLAHTVDGVKRLIYTFTNFSTLEVAQLLIVPVLLAAALYVRVFMLSWFGRGLVERVVLKRFWPLLFAIFGVLAFTLRGGLSIDSLISNYTLICYIPAGIIVPHIIFNTERRLAYVRVLIIIGIVLGVYALIQAVHGPFDYEVEYMLSGLTTTISSYEGVAYFRAFSLMNSGPAFCAALVMITLLSFFYFCRKEGRLRMNRPVVTMSLFTIICCFAATQRGPLVCFIFTLILVPFFTRPRAFFLMMGVGLVGFVGVIYNAVDLQDLMWDANEVLVSNVSNGFLQQNATIVTYGQRLVGFSGIMDPKLWTPFGISSRANQVTFVANDVAFSHDLISNFLEWFGYVGTGLFLGFCCVFVYRVIMRVQKMRDHPERALWVQCNLGVFLFMMIWQLFAGPAMGVSPLQFYFWVSIGNVLYAFSEPTSALTEKIVVAPDNSSGVWKPRGKLRESALHSAT